MKRTSPEILYSFDIVVAQCDAHDIALILSDDPRNETIKSFARAIEAAEWFAGVWHVMDDGSLVRMHRSFSFKKGKRFPTRSLSPTYPHSNVASLNLFWKLQRGICPLNDSIDDTVVLSNGQCIRARRSGFYVRDVRGEEKNAPNLFIVP